MSQVPRERLFVRAWAYIKPTSFQLHHVDAGEVLHHLRHFGYDADYLAGESSGADVAVAAGDHRHLLGLGEWGSDFGCDLQHEKTRLQSY